MTKKITRRALGGMAVSAALLMQVIATPVAAETQADQLVIAKSIANIATLDPGVNYEFVGMEILNNLYERLVMNDPQNLSKLIPGVSESYTIDGKMITFKLRDGQVFASGNPLKAEDVIWSLERVLQLESPTAFILEQFGWSTENFREKITAPDDMTVTMEINSDLGAGLLLNVLTSYGIVDKELAMANEADGDFGNNWLQGNSAGSGPYSLRIWRANELIIMDANKNYRLGEAPMKSVITRHMPEPATQRLTLEKGDIDIAINLTGDQIEAISDNADLNVLTVPTARILYLSLNTAIEPLGDPAVQEAIRYLINYKGMADSFLRGQVEIHQSVWPKGGWASNEANPYSYDVEKARKILADAGHADGFEMEFHTFSDSPYPEIAQALQESFSQVGITLEIITAEGRVHWPKLQKAGHQIAQARWGPDYNDPHSNIDGFVRAPLPREMNWSNPELEKKVKAAAVETDLAVREQMYVDLQKELQSDTPFIVMYQLVNNFGMRKNVENYINGPVATMVYYNYTTKK